MSVGLKFRMALNLFFIFYLRSEFRKKCWNANWDHCAHCDQVLS